MAAAIRRAFLRDQLWRFRSGARRPELESMFQLRDLTGAKKCEHCGASSGAKLDVELWVQGPRGGKGKANGAEP